MIGIIIKVSKTLVPRQTPTSQVLWDRIVQENQREGRVAPFCRSNPLSIGRYEREFMQKLQSLVKTKVGWNIFRHTFASRALQAGIPPSVVAGWLGHSVEVLLEHYGRFVPAEGRDSRIDAVDPRKLLR